MKLALLFAVLLLASYSGVPSWRLVDSGTTENLFGVAALDETTAVAVGWNGIILRSEDAGETWTRIESGTEHHLSAVSFGDSLQGTAVGVYDTILRTEDGGLTWAQQDSGLEYKYTWLHGVQFLDALHGTVVGSYSTILHTDDGGQTCQLQLSGFGPYPTLFSVYFTDKKHGTAVGWWRRHQPESFIVATSDGGTTWQIRDIDPRFQLALFGVAFTDPLNGIAVGEAGVMFFTVDAAGVVNVCLDARARFPRTPVDLVLGGYHLSGKTMEARIEPTLADLLERVRPSVLAPGHCTGWRAKSAFARAFAPGHYGPSVVGSMYVLQSPNA